MDLHNKSQKTLKKKDQTPLKYDLILKKFWTETKNWNWSSWASKFQINVANKSQIITQKDLFSLKYDWNMIFKYKKLVKMMESYLVELSFKGQPLSYVSPVKLSVQVKVMQTASAWSPKLYIPSTINTQINPVLLLYLRPIGLLGQY